MIRLSAWLASFDHISAVTPMTIKIDNKSYYACSYVARFETGENTPARQRGERQYWQSFVYCLGYLPSCYRRNTRIAFSIAGDPSDWYVASYYPQLKYYVQVPYCKPNEYHPFGASFLLAPWEAKDAIDCYEASPRKRIPITITKV